jgi:hypothetical protein
VAGSHTTYSHLDKMACKGLLRVNVSTDCNDVTLAPQCVKSVLDPFQAASVSKFAAPSVLLLPSEGQCIFAVYVYLGMCTKFKVYGRTVSH